MKNIIIATILFLLFAGVAYSATISTINSTDSGSASLTKINTNFTNLNSASISVPYVTVCSAGCTYTTDGTADDVQINQALTALSTVGGTVFIKKGTYDITASLTIYSGTHLMGENKLTILNPDSGLLKVIKNSGNLSNVTIEGLYIDMNNDDNGDESSYPISFVTDTVDKITIKNNYIKDSYNRIDFNGTNIEVYGNYFDNVLSGIGFRNSGSATEDYFVNIHDNTIINTDFSTTSTSEWGEGIEINLIDDYKSTASIYGNYISGMREDSIDCNSNYCVVTGNKIIMPSDETKDVHGITINGGSVHPSRSTVSNNIIENINNKGLYYSNAYVATTSLLTVSGNIFIGADDNVASSSGVYLNNNYNDSSIIGNTFENLDWGISNSQEDGYHAYLIANNYYNNGSNIRYSNNRYDAFGEDGFVVNSRMGIGTNTPNAMLQIDQASADSGNQSIPLTNPSLDLNRLSSSRGSFIRMGNTTNYSGIGGNDRYLSFYASATERMKLDSTGYLGIGTTTPTSLLHVASSTAAGTTTVAIGSAFNSKPGILCFWNGANYSLIYFPSNSVSPVMATSTTCN